MAISFTKSYSSSDDGSILYGADLQNLQSDINTNTVHIADTQTVTGNKTFSGTNTYSGTNTFSAGLQCTGATNTFGYGTGAGGTVTQATSKSTGVTLSKVTGQITMNNAALAANTTVSFTLTNTAIAATDLILINHVSGGTAGSYLVNAQAAAGSASINVRNITAGSLSEAIVLGFVVIKGVTA